MVIKFVDIEPEGGPPKKKPAAPAPATPGPPPASRDEDAGPDLAKPDTKGRGRKKPFR